MKGINLSYFFSNKSKAYKTIKSFNRTMVSFILQQWNDKNAK